MTFFEFGMKFITQSHIQKFEIVELYFQHESNSKGKFSIMIFFLMIFKDFNFLDASLVRDFHSKLKKSRKKVDEI